MMLVVKSRVMGEGDVPECPGLVPSTTESYWAGSRRASVYAEYGNGSRVTWGGTAMLPSPQGQKGCTDGRGRAGRPVPGGKLVVAMVEDWVVSTGGRGDGERGRRGSDVGRRGGELGRRDGDGGRRGGDGGRRGSNGGRRDGDGQ